MNSEKITRIVNVRNIVFAGLFMICLFSAALTAIAQNTQTSKNKADQNLKSSVRVNPSTLAMEFSLPLGNYPERAGNSMPVTFSYSSKVWNIPMKIWKKMSSIEQWIANTKFLDRAIARGDNFILSNAVKNVDEVTGYLRKELDYLIEKGYRLSEDGTRMIR